MYKREIIYKHECGSVRKEIKNKLKKKIPDANVQVRNHLLYIWKPRATIYRSVAPLRSYDYGSLLLLLLLLLHFHLMATAVAVPCSALPRLHHRNKPPP